MVSYAGIFSCRGIVDLFCQCHNCVYACHMVVAMSYSLMVLVVNVDENLIMRICKHRNECLVGVTVLGCTVKG